MYRRIAHMSPFLSACALSGCIHLGLHGGVQRMEERVVEDNDADMKVAMVELSGELNLEGGGGLLGGATDNVLGRTREQLDLAAHDDEVAAVIVRISSPGGEIYPSLELHRELVRFREATGKPVVAYVPDVAASGGYLAAVGADEIVADDSALTGSIGVVLLRPEVSGLMELVGVKVNVIKAGENKDLGSPFRELTDADREQIASFAQYYHSRFKDFVAAGRADLLDASKLDEVADGRVFTAPDAVKLGLVDAIGDLADAHQRAAARAGFSADNTNLVIYRRPHAYGHNPYALSSAPGGMQVNLDVTDVLPRPRFLYLWQP